MIYLYSALINLALTCSSMASAKSSSTAEEVLADASRYTVKIHSQTDIALNQDEAGSRSGMGFLIERERGWLLTNAHVATRSPATIKVQFKDGKQFIDAKRIHVDPLIDLAILEIPSRAVPSDSKEAELACDQISVAEHPCWHLGIRGACPSPHRAVSSRGWLSILSKKTGTTSVEQGIEALHGFERDRVDHAAVLAAALLAGRAYDIGQLEELPPRMGKAASLEHGSGVAALAIELVVAAIGIGLQDP